MRKAEPIRRAQRPPTYSAKLLRQLMEAHRNSKLQRSQDGSGASEVITVKNFGEQTELLWREDEVHKRISGWARENRDWTQQSLQYTQCDHATPHGLCTTWLCFCFPTPSNRCVLISQHLGQEKEWILIVSCAQSTRESGHGDRCYGGTQKQLRLYNIMKSKKQIGYFAIFRKEHWSTVVLCVPHSSLIPTVNTHHASCSLHCIFIYSYQLLGTATREITRTC